MKRAFVERTIAPLATRTTSGTSNTANVMRAELVTIAIKMESITGAGYQKVGFKIDFSHNDSDWWLAKDIVRTGSAGTLITRVPALAKYIRVRWDVAGSPTATFSVDLHWLEE